MPLSETAHLLLIHSQRLVDNIHCALLKSVSVGLRHSRRNPLVARKTAAYGRRDYYHVARKCGRNMLVLLQYLASARSKTSHRKVLLAGVGMLFIQEGIVERTAPVLAEVTKAAYRDK